MCIHFVAELLRTPPHGLGPSPGPPAQPGPPRRGERYRRLLSYVAKTVRKLAHPDLTRGRITPYLIQHVLARPCGVDVPDARLAHELFETPAARRCCPTGAFEADGPVLLRSDIRPVR